MGKLQSSLDSKFHGQVRPNYLEEIMTTRKLFGNLDVFQEANEAASKRMKLMEEAYEKLYSSRSASSHKRDSIPKASSSGSSEKRKVVA